MPSHQHGQSLLVLVVLLGALLSALWWTTEAGSAVNEKQRLANAADAAALSAAVWQARALNFDAYTNRAIVANEAALAQSVSLRSWSSYMTRLLPSAALVTAWVPYLNTAMMTLQRLWHVVDAALQPSLMTLEATTSLISHDIAAAQRVMHLGTVTVVPALVRESLAETDPRYRLSTGGEAAVAVWASEWLRFASFYGGSFRWRQRDVVHRSLDGFSSDRRYTLRPLLGTSIVRFEKRGGTELVDFDNWRALDTQSLHARRGLLFGSIRERTPIAWGGSESGQPSFSRGEHGDSYRRNPRASRLADRAVRRSVGYLGLPSLYDLSAAQRESFAPPRILVRVILDDSARFAQLSVAKQNLRYAVFDVVRVAEAATEQPYTALLRARLGRALLPTLADQSDGGVVALAAAAALAARPDLFDITYRSAGTTRVDAATALEAWELEVRWCRELFFAPLKYLIPALLRMSSTSWFDQACYARDSLPLVAKAYVLRPAVPGESPLR